MSRSFATVRRQLQRLSRGLPRTPREAGYSLLLLAELRDQGWQQSVRARRAVDAHGGPVPWMPYSAAAWLNSALRTSDRVFEFGAGSSTLWLAERVESVTSVEHDPTWERMLRQRLPSNVELTLAERDRYPDLLDDRYDVVFVDGIRRVDCCTRAGATGAEMVVLDDAERPMFEEAHAVLASFGYGRIDFHGTKPTRPEPTMTSVYLHSLERLLSR